MARAPTLLFQGLLFPIDPMPEIQTMGICKYHHQLLIACVLDRLADGYKKRYRSSQMA